MLNKAELSIFLATLDKINHPALLLTTKENSSSLNNTFENRDSGKGPVTSNF